MLSLPALSLSFCFSLSFAFSLCAHDSTFKTASPPPSCSRARSLPGLSLLMPIVLLLPGLLFASHRIILLSVLSPPSLCRVCVSVNLSTDSWTLLNYSLLKLSLSLSLQHTWYTVGCVALQPYSRASRTSTVNRPSSQLMVVVAVVVIGPLSI